MASAALPSRHIATRYPSHAICPQESPVLIWSSPRYLTTARRPGVCAFLLVLSALALPAHAYIGPGAGFALASSFLVVFVTIVLAFLALFALPFRMLWRSLRRGRRTKPLVRRLIIVGLDGQDPKLTDRFLAEGKLPNFKKLGETGCYHRLRSTYPSVSPVAWSSFSTGVHPAKHNIFDFLDRDPRTYLPFLSSTHIGKVEKVLKLGKYRIPLHKPELRLMRKSKPFWTILGEHHIWSTVLRVPITFPPDKFYGAELAAMCVPDLLGTQGTFLLFTTRPSGEKFKEGGARFPLSSNGSRDVLKGTIQGPGDGFLEGEPPMELPLVLELDRAARRAKVKIDTESVDIALGELSDWVKLSFKTALGIRAAGICRLQLTEIDEHVSLYVTPISLDPEQPAMPVSHPSYYATYLAKKIGPYSTLGLAEDTWALNEGVIDDGTFLKQTWDVNTEREAMFFAALERLRTGTLTCVFDATDRIQHMFWRYLEPGHPAARGIENPEHKNAIEDLYLRNDALVGRVLEKVQDGDVVMVISDHGFNSFRRGVNLNAWLLKEGYLHLKAGCDGTSEWLREIDWSRTKAYALGLTGMFLNLEGREAEGIVKPGREAAELKAEIAAKLRGLVDEETGEVGINEAFETAKLYTGPYLVNAPDWLIGYNAGYRTSWDCATGVVAGPVFEDNTKAWSGDHCIDPRIVPGIFFCNRKIDDDDPALMDIAPTALRLFGLEPPAHMDGKPLFKAESFKTETPKAAGAEAR
ncbi:MAG: nucleotide pyrophosphatase [Thermoanaerobaculia bacterium]|nr:nucleotide pyrophosphatase [Thermoanaerobaculia bacterium]